MLRNYMRNIEIYRIFRLQNCHKRFYRLKTALSQQQSIKPSEDHVEPAENPLVGEIYPSQAVPIPVVANEKEPVVLPFDNVPGPKALKYLSTIKNYFSEFGTQITARILTMGLNVGYQLEKRTPLKNLSVLFDDYGPVVRFVSPVGSDIVLLNHPDHIQKVYTTEGEYPVRSSLDSLEKYRMERRNQIHGGIYGSHGHDWSRQRSLVFAPLNNSVAQHIQSLSEVCENFTQKLYNIRNPQDELTRDLYEELHKWSFDCMGLILFSKRFSMLDTELIYNQCDMSWLYYSLEKASDAIIKCESGLHFWKLFATPSWTTLVKYCDSLDNLIGKFVLEAEQSINYNGIENNFVPENPSLIKAMLLGDEKLSPEDVTTVIMDMLLIGVNTITSSTAFLLYYLSKYKKVQKKLFCEIDKAFPISAVLDVKTIRNQTPYLQACIKETLRLVPPIPVITRVLPKNITLDKYNIPRGTVIIMSTQDSSLKEGNYDDARAFLPERWLSPDSKDYHTFASIPFGYGSRKCLAQNISETIMSMLTIKVLQKYRLEYHYGDVEPLRSFIAKPNRPLKIRFIDRV